MIKLCYKYKMDNITLEMKNIFAELEKAQYTKRIDISFKKINDENIHHLIEKIFHLDLNKINILCIKACNLTDNTFKLLIKSLQFIEDLEEIDISNNNITTLKYLKYLDLNNVNCINASECHLNGNNVLPLDLIVKMPKLMFLDFKFNNDKNTIIFTLDQLNALPHKCKIIIQTSIVNVEISDINDSSKINNISLKTWYEDKFGNFMGYTSKEIMDTLGIVQSPLIKSARIIKSKPLLS